MHRARQFEACQVAARGLSFDLWPPWVAKAKQFCGLVEGFADSVVLRGTETHILPDATHSEDLGVAAGGKEQAVRKRRIVRQTRGQGMGFKVIDGDQWLVPYQ